jgi:hypothetical protein
MSKNKNPYAAGSKYAKIFDDWGKAKGQTISRNDLIAKGHSPHDVTVVLSPRDEGASRGDCRGNASAQGHKYFAKIVGQGHGKKFRRCWRKTVLDTLKRKSQRDAVPADKKATKVTKAKATKAKTAKTAKTAKSKTRKAKTAKVKA